LILIFQKSLDTYKGFGLNVYALVKTYKNAKIPYWKTVNLGDDLMLYSKILVAFDGSYAADEALEQALRLNQLLPGSVLKVIHSFDIPNFVLGEALIMPSGDLNNDIYAEAQAVVERAKALVAPFPNTSVVMIQGDAARTILSEAEAMHSDLIVIGSRGISGIQELLLGSVSHYVVQHADIPVLVVKKSHAVL
jgi:nucleotide-binding universal stress UspA family protein